MSAPRIQSSAPGDSPAAAPAAGWTDEDEVALNLYEDNTATRRNNGEAIPQRWLDEAARLKAKKNNRPMGKGPASLPVFGHPEATNIQPHLYANLIPLHADSHETLDRYERRTRELHAGLVEKLGMARYRHWRR